MFTPSRLMVLFLAMAVAVPAAAQEADPPPPVEVSHLIGPLHVLLCNGNAQMVASIGPDGTLLVDTGYGVTAEAVQKALTDLGGGPARVIINTHGDADHVGGNAVLGESAVIIAHPAVRRLMGTYFALPAVSTDGMPAISVETETTVYFNGDVIRLLPVPGGHTAGDVVVHFTGSGVAFLGDVVLAGTFPNADPARGGDAQRLAEVLRGLKATLPADTVLVPAHGDALSMSELETYIDMVEGTTAAVASEAAAGRDLDEILERQPLAPWAEWERPDRGLGFDDWTSEIYASLSGETTQSICEPMTEALVKDDVEAAVEVYNTLKMEQPKSWSFAENELNMLGYQLLQREMVDEAIAIFELNVDAYPEAFNTYDSLAEAYMTAGNDTLAIANYQRSLDLNPDNTNATAMLTRLRGE